MVIVRKFVSVLTKGEVILESEIIPLLHLIKATLNSYFYIYGAISKFIAGFAQERIRSPL